MRCTLEICRTACKNEIPSFYLRKTGERHLCDMIDVFMAFFILSVDSPKKKNCILKGKRSGAGADITTRKSQ